tara:strand:+ start:167 stop:439 length:273 start_codon:yes stop_codon:yes gene_type:complete
MKNAKSFYKKLAKLIEEEKPDHVKLCYDTGAMAVFVVRKDAKFIEGRTSVGGTSWHGVLTPVTEPVNSVGNEAKAVIGEPIYIDLEAVQY